MKRTSLLVLIILLWAGAAWAIPPMPGTPIGVSGGAQAYDADLTTYAGITPSANVQTLLGSANYAAFRTNLSLVPGTDVQAYHALLASLAGLTTAQGDIIYFTASNTAAVLNKGTAGQLLQMNSGATSPEWTSSLSAIFTFGNGATSAGYIYFLEDSTNGTDKTKLIGAETLAADITLTLPSTTDTLVGRDTTDTLTNKTLTTPYITLPTVDGHAALSLSAAQVSGTIISNAGQALADVNHTLPAAAAGYNFIGFVGTALAATNYYRFTAATAATMCLDGTCGKSYVTIDTPTQGATVACYTAQVSSTGLKTDPNLAIGTADATKAKHTSTIEFDVSGTGYQKTTSEAAIGNDVIPQGKWGLTTLEIGADGTIDYNEAAANATGYDSEALAIAALPTVSADHVQIGYITVTKSDGAFTLGTTELGAANVTANYYDSAAYTKPYNWICNTGTGTWVTD